MYPREPAPAGSTRIPISDLLDLGPALEFSSQIPLEMSFDPSALTLNNPAAIFVSCYNSTSRQWENQPRRSIDMTNHRITALISHFSWYQVSEDLSLGHLTLPTLAPGETSVASTGRTGTPAANPASHAAIDTRVIYTLASMVSLLLQYLFI